MGQLSKSRVAETVGVHIPKDIVRLIEARAEAIGHKKSRYAAMIIDWWAKQGAPAVSKVDENMRMEVMSQLASIGAQGQQSPLSQTSTLRAKMVHAESSRPEQPELFSERWFVSLAVRVLSRSPQTRISPTTTDPYELVRFIEEHCQHMAEGSPDSTGYMRKFFIKSLSARMAQLAESESPTATRDFIADAVETWMHNLFDLPYQPRIRQKITQSPANLRK